VKDCHVFLEQIHKNNDIWTQVYQKLLARLCQWKGDPPPPPQAPPKLPLQSEPMGPTPEQYPLNMAPVYLATKTVNTKMNVSFSGEETCGGSVDT